MWYNWDQTLPIRNTPREEKNWQLLPLQRMTQSGKRIGKRNWQPEPAVQDTNEKCTVIQLGNLGSFRRRQLRKVIGIQWPHKISNNKLYKIKGTKPLSFTITERRWELLRLILRLPADCPARKAMRYSFEEKTNKIFRGRRRTTMVNTQNEEIKRTKGDDITFSLHKSVYRISTRRPRTESSDQRLYSKL